MIYGLKGILVVQNVTDVVLNVNNVFYEVKVTNISEKTIGSEVFLYTYQVIREDDEYLIGFETLREKDLFMQLINVNGVGPKTALGILTATNPDRFFEAVATEDLSYLKKLPGVGPKGASQIILDLKGKLQTDTSKGTNPHEAEVTLALSNLGFKKAEITKVMKKVSLRALSANELLKLALNELRK
ncbi:MAG: Holliday junction branch migration protein RuvA [Bacilli bacterium]|jgi:Holliday junction DNA helicase RuvA|nr:Holliday junction branch migration protein RuvA [Bacilli bacterium]